MAKLIRQLTAISPRSGSPPGRQLLALMMCTMLVFGSVAPGFAVAGESDSEGEGTTPIEVPVGPPDFDPGGEETGLEEEGPDSGGEEEGAGVETETEVEIETPVPAEVTGPAPEAPVEAPPPSPTPAPEPPPAAAPETEVQKADEPNEPVANQSITAPKQTRSDPDTAAASAAGQEAPSPVESEAPPPAPQPVAVPPRDHGRDLSGKDTYIVRPGDCLWHIAAAALPADSDTLAIEDKVKELWSMNEDRIGTGDPNLIYPGTLLRLR